MLRLLQEEVRVIFERDPAARSILEVVICYPGFHAIIFHRIAHFMYTKRLFFIARLISHLSRFFTAIEIHPGAQIGKGFFIDHGSGVVIGETTEIGDNVTIYQGVTLGGTGKEKGKRHPTIGNNVTISAGAKLLGSFTVGDNARIGGGSVVLKSIPSDCTAVGVPARIVKKDGNPIQDKDVNLNHQMLPDPVADALNAMQDKIIELENKLAKHEEEGLLNAGYEYLEWKKRRINSTKSTCG